MLCNLLTSVPLADLERQIGLLTLPLLPPIAVTSLAVIYHATLCGSCQVPRCSCVQGPPSIIQCAALQEMFSQSGQKGPQKTTQSLGAGAGPPPGDLRTRDYAITLPVLPKHLPPTAPETPGGDKWAGHLSQDKFWEGFVVSSFPVAFSEPSLPGSTAW